jgi:hypothetical protein
MAAGVVVSALIFGFAHSNYESWPPYSRGVEIFVDACFWAVLFINFGLVVTVIAHFVYDLVLFGLFAGAGTAVEYRVTAGIILIALLSPALVVVWQWVRQRGFVPAPEDARFGAWTPDAAEDTPVAVAPRQAGVFTARARRLALAAAIVGVVVSVARPPRPTLGPRFTADRTRVVQTADSVLRARGVSPAGWTRLTSVGTDTLDAWPRFLRQHKLVGEAQRFASTYLPPTWWAVRYVHTNGSASQRTEEWRVRVRPDGRPLDTRHIVPESAHGDSVDSTTLRAIALASLAREGIDTSKLQESELRQSARQQRRDAVLSYADTSTKLPDGAVARAWVQLAGAEPVVARRGVELPEAFLRADRQRQTTRTAIAGAVILLLFGLVVTGAIFVKRRRGILVDDGTLGRRDAFLFLGGLLLLSTLSTFNALPSQLFTYDTAQPWSNFLATRALSFVVAIPVALVVFGLWLALGAMRRRVGIPMLPGQPSRSARNDVLAAGLGLGSVFFIISQLDSFASSGGMPRTPVTTLNDLLPWLGGVLSMPMSTLIGVATIGIPFLVVGALTQRWSLRALMSAVLVALLIALAWSTSSRTADINPVRVAIALVALASLSVPLVFWG